MSSLIRIQDFMEMYYPDSNIPAYYYEDHQMEFCVPAQSALTHPPAQYLEQLYSKAARLSYCATPYGIYYGCIRLDGPADRRLILGPVGNIPFSESDLHDLCRDYLVPQDQREPFARFLGAIPQLSLTPFITRLAFLNYCLHGERLHVNDYLPSETARVSDVGVMAETNYQNKEDLQHNKSYELENLTMNYVRAGNPEGLLQLTANESNYHPGIMGPTALRQIKNTIIISTTIATRAAIDGGLDYDTAYQLSDRFIQEAERLQDPDSLYALLSQVAYTFAAQVRNARTPLTSNDRILKAIRYIQQNTNQHLSVSDVADYVGYSQSYFSTYFKNELGFSVSAFIMRCRLEEARELLQYTDKPLHVISNYLCFSSQSHFQTAFRKQYGVTPLEYRKNPRMR